MKRGKRLIVLLGVPLITTLLLSGCGALATAPTSSGESLRVMSVAGGESDSRPTINVSGQGTASARPDLARIALSVESVDEDADRAIRDNNRRTQAVIEAAKQLGVEEEDIQTTDYRLWIEERHDNNGWPTGERRYHVTNSLVIRLRAIDKTGELLSAIIEAGANKIQDISFGIADTSALEEEARRQAIANARAKAETMAQALGVEVGDVLYVTESHYVPPIYGMAEEAKMMAAATESVPIETGSFNVKVNVTVIFAIRQ